MAPDGLGDRAGGRPPPLLRLEQRGRQNLVGRTVGRQIIPIPTAAFRAPAGPLFRAPGTWITLIRDGPGLITRSSPATQTGLGRSSSVCKDMFHSGLTSTAFWSRTGRPCWTDWNAVRKIVQVMEYTPARSRLEGHPAGRVAQNTSTRVRLRAAPPRRASAGDRGAVCPPGGAGEEPASIRLTPRR